MHDELRCIMHTSRFTQMGRWSGWFEVAGRRTELDPATTLGTRDKSWGVRPVGEPEGGAPPRAGREPGVYWVWSPIAWDDGTTTQFGTFEDRDGRPTQLSAHQLPLYDDPEKIPAPEDERVVEMAQAKHEIHWRKGTRLAERAEFAFTTPAGEPVAFALEPLIRFHMLGIGYQHPAWGHGVWQGEEKIGGESWRLDQLDLTDYKHVHVHQICRASGRGRGGIGTLETIAFGRHAPSGFAAFLDGAP
jgi:hypothetical protein